MAQSLYYIEKTVCHRDWFWENKTNYATKDWTGFHVWHVLAGEGQIIGEDCTVLLHPGDIFLFDLSKAYFCTHNPQQPMTVIAMHFEADNLQDGSSYFSCNNFLSEMLFRCMSAEDRTKREMWFNVIVEELINLQKPGTVSVSTVIAEAMKLIEDSCCTSLKLSEIASALSYSPNHLTKRFHKETGMTPEQYRISRRIELSKNILLYSEKSIFEIAVDLGYNDQSHFSKQFKAVVGMSPATYREAFRNQTR